MKIGDIIDGRKIGLKVDKDSGDNPADYYCTTYQMRNFYRQFADGFFSNLDIMNYIQHHSAALHCKKGYKVLDVCCGRSLMLPLLRYYAPDIASYTGVDISDANIREAQRGVNKPIEDTDSYYPFATRWICADVASMDTIITDKFDMIIYTSAIEHMHKDAGVASLRACFSMLKPNRLMFLSCPNTPGNGYNTQYAAHIYEWGYDELKTKLQSIGYEIESEFGLVMKVRTLKKHIETLAPEVRGFCDFILDYIPMVWASTLLAIPFPKESDEVLFIIRKPDMRRLV